MTCKGAVKEKAISRIAIQRIIELGEVSRQVEMLRDQFVDPVYSLVKGYKAGAVSRGFAFELTDEAAAAMIQAACGYCGLRETDRYNGIDRIDNTAGYSESNCISCCRWCNFAKGQRHVDDFLKWLRWVARRAPKP